VGELELFHAGSIFNLYGQYILSEKQNAGELEVITNQDTFISGVQCIFCIHGIYQQ